MDFSEILFFQESIFSYRLICINLLFWLFWLFWLCLYTIKPTKMLPECVPFIIFYFVFRLTYPVNPKFRYRYPPPTVSVLTNIINALASSPRFYSQVLHLMNKLNLPAPFGMLSSTPPLVRG